MHVVPRPEPPPSRAADADSSGIWQRLIGGDKRQFLAAVLPLLKDRKSLAEDRFVIKLLCENNLLFPLLSDPGEFPLDEAIEVARRGMREDSIKPGTVSNELFSHQDMLPTLVAAAGEPDIVEKCKKGYKAGEKTFKVHLDGYNLLPHLRGQVKENPRPAFIYWSDEGDLMALRSGDWKVHFAVQRDEGADAWQDPFVQLRFPKLMNLRTDPFEQADVSGSLYYWKWRVDHTFMLAPAGAVVGMFMKTLMEFPPRQSPESWSPGAVMEKLRQKQEMLESQSGAGVK